MIINNYNLQRIVLGIHITDPNSPWLQAARKLYGFFKFFFSNKIFPIDRMVKDPQILTKQGQIFMITMKWTNFQECLESVYQL